MAQTYTIHVHAIPLSDDDGNRANTVTKAAFLEAVENVSGIFKAADLRFAFDPNKDWKPRKSTVLNSLNNGGGGKWWEAANEVAGQHKGRLVIFLRYGKPNAENTPANNWFAYPPDTGQNVPPRTPLPTENVDFVAITNQANKFSTNGRTLAHEIGHYLGLFHTHPSWGPMTDFDKIVDIVEAEGAAGLNGDLLSDTPPDPGPDYYKAKVSSDLCGGPATFKIAGVNFSPDRSNVMSYFRCSPVTLSPKQIEVIRSTLNHPLRAHLIAASRGTRYLGVFRAGTDAHALWVGDDWEGFNAKWKQLSEDGLRLIDMETYVAAGTRRYTGVFRAGNDAHALWVGDDWEGFKAKWQQLAANGLRLTDFETYLVGSTRKYAGVFRAGNDAHALWVGDDWNGFKAKWQQLSAEGLRLIDLETYVDGSTRKYAGVFRAGNDAHALWVGDDWEGFEAKCQQLSADGLRLIDLETYVDGSTRKYAGVFRAGTDAHALWVGDDWDGFKTKWQELSAKGLRLTKIEVYGPSVS
jgi:hypothetical protein